MQILKRAIILGTALLSIGTWALPARAQVFTFSKEQVIQFTPQNPFDRLPDGRPKVPDDLIEKARELSAEEIFAILPNKGYRNQYEDGFQVLYPEKKLVGRAFTVQFMPVRPDVEGAAAAQAKARGLASLRNQAAIDMLQPGDVLVVDLFGRK